MISGHATPEGTQIRAGQFAGLAFNPLGETGLRVSAAGFGCYRVNAGVTAHAEALEKALTSGINIIDTSANYADGGSERLIGSVLADLIDAGRIARQQVVVVSKGGYLQGQNYVMSQQRKQDGNPFEDLVEYADGLEHCIHPDFLDDQIGRTLDRLGLGTLDGYLLHNPEYYLGWAHKNGIDPDRARREYGRRIDRAFRHLEREVHRGRIRFYGISSNTFPAPGDDPEFTALDRVWETAAGIGGGHHFRIVQLPFNLLEAGAVLEKNQQDHRSVLEMAIEKRLGVMVNRPLNAFTGRRMVRLASVDVRARMDYKEIIQCIKDLALSETRLWRRILPGLASVPPGLRARIKQQGCFAETLKHNWRSFGAYERWREARDGIFLPRIQGVMDFLLPLADNQPDLADWMTSHEKILDRALRAVASIYADDAVALEKKILNMIGTADAAWARPGTLSQRAIRALLSTAGVSTVLVGMRRPAYVADVLAELGNPTGQIDRNAAWEHLRQGAEGLFTT
ncbi:aldo/keto reductase [Desulfosarcina alkanivorans]|uniref:Aldo/keto reductase n=1 Tax=Desulfosarcina alkanivorans TaxID=571177 RepID=A0A5K7YCN4_9BACT|nr:aldo/keto reductase [Desulfosarcina alkanivorans]BBO66706.1 aldo/keto reductase [Desulfosarcina alkanivorans]